MKYSNLLLYREFGLLYIKVLVRLPCPLIKQHEALSLEWGIAAHQLVSS